MVKWKMERREERNGITRWWKLWERGNGETKKPRKRKIGRRGNGERENGKIQKWDGFMEKWEIFVMNEWVRWAAELLVENNRTETEIRRQRGWHGHDIWPLPSLPSLSPHPSPPQKKETRDRLSGHCLHLQSIWRIQVSFCILSMRRRKRRESCSQVTEPSDSFLFGYLIHWTKARREMKQLKVNIYHKYLLNQFLPFIFFL